MTQFLGTKGHKVFRTRDAHTRAATKWLDAYLGRPRNYMRMGHYTVIVAGAKLVSGFQYATDGSGEYGVPRTSEFYADHRADRMRQMGLVLEAFRRHAPDHPHAAGIRHDIRMECERLDVQPWELTLALYGFVLEGTGGNCTAYVRNDGEVEECITVADDARAPTALTQDVVVGTRMEGEDPVHLHGYTLANVLEALEHPSMEYHLLELRLHNLVTRSVGV